jgi:hypothetical protein
MSQVGFISIGMPQVGFISIGMPQVGFHWTVCQKSASTGQYATSRLPLDGMPQVGFHWTVCHKSASTGRIFMVLDIWVFFAKYAKKIQVSLKSDQNNGYFT